MAGQAATPGEIQGGIQGRYIPPSQTDRSIGATIAGIAFDHPSRMRWFIAFGLSVLLTGWLVIAMMWKFYWGVGVWGNNIPVTWALDIVSYDWWMGNACGALLVSALLLLLRQYWRGALNRAAETVALFCACASGVYPIIHLGRSWFFYWTLPYPNDLLLWPQFRSPLVWDAFDIISFIFVALLFWYVGMLPDLATLRDRAGNITQKRMYGIAALGWRGSAVHWARWLQTYRILAILGMLQAVCVQCGASVMYAGTVEPGWHDTLLPIEFIVGAALSGLGMTAVLVSVLRYLYPVESLITRKHLDVIGRLILAVGLLLTYCYCADYFFTALGGDSYDRAAMMRRFGGTYAWSWWFVVGFALLPVHLLWFAPIRRSAGMLFIVGMSMMTGIWSDHFMTLIMAQHHDFLPSSVAFYTTSFWAITTFLGTIGLFAALVLLVIRYVPIASIIESRLLVRQQEAAAHA